MNPKTVARRGAIKALSLLENADKPLSAILDDLHLPVEARPFAREIASGTVRHRARCDWTLQPLLRKPLHKLDAAVRAALRLAVYERCALQTPVRAVADEYAEAMRDARLVSAVGFVNAIARRLPDAWRASPDKERDPLAFLTHEYSYPDWLVRRWLERGGFDECAALCHAGNEIAPLCLRVNTRRASKQQVVESLVSRGLAARAGTVSPDAVVVERSGAALGSPDAWPEWTSGFIIAQDEAAQLVSRFAVACFFDAQSASSDERATTQNPIETERTITKRTIIDACAAPGGKSTHLAQLDDRAQIIACDLAAGRLKLVRQNAERLGLSSISTRAGDFREMARATDQADSSSSNDETLPRADLVLLDAPCLGTGTLRRRPDAKWRKSLAQLKELADLQRELLDAAALVVRPGGVLAYATCSLEPEENDDQARAFLARHPSWRLVVPMVVPTANDSGIETETGADEGRFVGGDGFLRTLPHRDGCDGAFAACFVRSRE